MFLKIMTKQEYLENWACCLCRCLAKCIFLPAGLVKSMRIFNLQLNNRGRSQCATSAIANYYDLYSWKQTNFDPN